MNRIIPFVFLTFMSFMSGCLVRPLTAGEMYGPAATKPVSFDFKKTEKEFSFSAGANTIGTIDVTPGPHGVAYHAELNSTGVEAIYDAKGNMIPKMDESIRANFESTNIRQKIVTDGENARFDRLMNSVDRSLPIIAPLIGPPAPQPGSSPETGPSIPPVP